MTPRRRKDESIEGAVAALIRRIAQGSSLRGGSIPTRIRSFDELRLDAAAVRVLDALPPWLRLPVLRERYPRLLNRIAAVWDDARAFDAQIDSLLIDQRGGRQGFPFEVLRELTALREHHVRAVRGRG